MGGDGLPVRITPGPFGRESEFQNQTYHNKIKILILTMKTITMDQLGMLKAKLENEAKGGRTHIKVVTTTTVKINIEEYVEQRTEIVEKQCQLKKEHHDDKMQQSVIAVYHNDVFIRTISSDVKGLYRDYDISIISMKQLAIERKKKESKITRCERLCHKRDITFKEICELQNMYDHIVNHETSDRMMKLKKNIVRTINEFYK